MFIRHYMSLERNVICHWWQQALRTTESCPDLDISHISIWLNPHFCGVCFHFRLCSSTRGSLCELKFFIFLVLLRFLTSTSHLFRLMLEYCFRTLLSYVLFINRQTLRCCTSSFRCLCTAFSFLPPGNVLSFGWSTAVVLCHYLRAPYPYDT